MICLSSKVKYFAIELFSTIFNSQQLFIFKALVTANTPLDLHTHVITLRNTLC